MSFDAWSRNDPLAGNSNFFFFHKAMKITNYIAQKNIRLIIMNTN